jgi:integrase
MSDTHHCNAIKLIHRYILYRNDLSRQTLQSIKESAMALTKWLGERNLNQVSLQEFVDWQFRNRNPTYAERLTKHVVWFSQWLHQAGWLREDPTIGLDKPRVQKKKPKLGYTVEEYVKLRDNADEYMRSFAIIAMHTGMASVDVCHLKWSEVNLNEQLIIRERAKMRTRNQATATIPIDPESDLWDELQRLRRMYYRGNAESWVNPYLYSYYSQSRHLFLYYFRQACRKAGIENRGTHGFRRAWCSVIANDTRMNVMHAIAATGHTNVQSLKPYVTVDVDELRQSVLPRLSRHYKKIRGVGVEQIDVSAKQPENDKRNGARQDQQDELRGAAGHAPALPLLDTGEVPGETTEPGKHIAE